MKHLLAGGNDLVWWQEKAIHPRVPQLHPVAEANDGEVEQNKLFDQSKLSKLRMAKGKDEPVSQENQ